MMAESWIVCRHPDPERSGWTTITGQPGRWVVPDMEGRKAAMVKEGIDAFIAAGLSFDLTISDASASEVMTSPDSVGAGDFLTVMVPRSAGDRYAWASVDLSAAGEFAIGRLVRGPDVARWLEQLGKHYGEERFHKEHLQVRPRWSLTDLIPEPGQAIKRAVGGAR